MLKLTYITTHF